MSLELVLGWEERVEARRIVSARSRNNAGWRATLPQRGGDGRRRGRAPSQPNPSAWAGFGIPRAPHANGARASGPRPVFPASRRPLAHSARHSFLIGVGFFCSGRAVVLAPPRQTPVITSWICFFEGWSMPISTKLN